ncbi:MAG: hypothetical protein ACYDA9_20675 [Terriglobia bacterium]
MRRIELTITFTDDDGTAHRATETVEACDPPDATADHRVAHILLTELKVTVGKQAVPKHNATAWGWLQFPSQPASIDQYFDIWNSQAVWRELATLVMGAEGDLILAQAFKALEPAREPQFADETAINDLYYVHDRKITLLNQSVHAVIKVQDLVNRLLHESLGGDLVDTSNRNWEKTQLTRDNVEERLEAKHALGEISQADLDTITQALAIPKNTPKGQTALSYRNRMAHHIRPSVDYSMFFSALESRAGEELKDPEGKVRAIRHVMRAKPPVQYRFEELHAASSEYLDAIVAMLDKLSKIDILRR